MQTVRDLWCLCRHAGCTALRDAAGRDVGLDVHRGHPVLVAMFSSSCPIAEAKRPDARVLLVSFDAEHDTPARLRELARARRLDARWELAAAGDGDARTIAAVLGVRYRKLASASYMHDFAIVALDNDGRTRGRISAGSEHDLLVRDLRSLQWRGS